MTIRGAAPQASGGLHSRPGAEAITSGTIQPSLGIALDSRMDLGLDHDFLWLDAPSRCSEFFERGVSFRT